MPRVILVCDEEATIADSLSKAGPSLDVSVLTETKDKVVERARKAKPDLVVLDIQQKNALEVLSLLKTGQTTKDIPVVVIARDDQLELREMALEVGAEGFIPKPLGRDFLPKLMLFVSGRKT